MSSLKSLARTGVPALVICFVLGMSSQAQASFLIPMLPVFPMGSDCNNNGIDDTIDISNGTSLDCNLNGLPDECDVDNSGCIGCGSVTPTEFPMSVIFLQGLRRIVTATGFPMLANS